MLIGSWTKRIIIIVTEDYEHSLFRQRAGRKPFMPTDLAWLSFFSSTIFVSLVMTDSTICPNCNLLNFNRLVQSLLKINVPKHICGSGLNQLASFELALIFVAGM